MVADAIPSEKYRSTALSSEMKSKLAPPVITDAIVPMVWLLECDLPVDAERFATTAATLSDSTHTGFLDQR